MIVLKHELILAGSTFATGGKDVYLACSLQDDTFVLSSLQNMATVMELRSRNNGSLLDNIPLPASLSSGGYISSLCPGDGDSDFYYIVSSTTDPGSIYQCAPPRA